MLSRRVFLGGLLALAGGGYGLPGAMASAFDDVVAPLPKGRFVDVVPFRAEGRQVMEKAFGKGLDGRLLTDLSTLLPGTLVTSNSRFYIRTRTPDKLPPIANWKVRLGSQSSVSASHLDSIRVPCGIHVMECSGNGRGGHYGLISCARWEGVPVLDVVTALPSSKPDDLLLINGYDRYAEPSVTSLPGASWIFTREQLRDAFLATRMNGVPLPSDHGAPVRLIKPGWYGCTCIKWVDEIRWVGQSEPATAQMREFAARTLQTGVPRLAREYQSAVIDFVAMPVRVEKWVVDLDIMYRVVGIQWGDGAPCRKLYIRFGRTDPWAPVDRCPTQPADAGWWLWSHVWKPTVPGVHQIQVGVKDSRLRLRRMERGDYTRLVEIYE